MSLSQPGSHEEISLVTNLNLSDTSGMTRCTQSAYLNGTSGSDSFLRRLLRIAVTVKVFRFLHEVHWSASSHLAVGWTHFVLTILASTPVAHHECSMRGS